MCYLLLDPTCSLQITEEVIVETGVIYVLFPQWHHLVSLLHLRLHETFQHTPLIVLHPVILQLPHLVVLIVIKMLHNHQMEQLKMNIMSFNLDAYLSQHIDIDRHWWEHWLNIIFNINVHSFSISLLLYIWLCIKLLIIFTKPKQTSVIKDPVTFSLLHPTVRMTYFWQISPWYKKRFYYSHWMFNYMIVHISYNSYCYSKFGYSMLIHHRAIYCIYV